MVCRRKRSPSAFTPPKCNVPSPLFEYSGRRCYSIGGLFRSLCLSVALRFVDKRCKIGLVQKSNRNARKTFQLIPFSTSSAHPNLKRGANWMAIIWHWNSGQTAADRTKLCIDMYWEFVGGLSIGATPDTQLSPNSPPKKNWGSQNSPFKLRPNGSRWSNTLKW